MMGKYFMLVFAYLLILLMHLKELFNFDEVHCFFPFKDYVFGVISQNLCLTQDHKDVLMFSPRSFKFQIFHLNL